MPETARADPLDARLRQVAGALVAEAPAPPPFPAGARGSLAPARRRPATRRRAAWVAVAASAAVLALVAGVVAVIGASRDDEAKTAMTGPPPASPAERLFVGAHEILPDGSVVRAYPDDGRLEYLLGLRALADGGVLALGARPAAESSAATGAQYALLAYDRAGNLVFDRDIEPRALFGATDTEAILGAVPDGQQHSMADVRILAHDLATGDERTAFSEAAGDPERVGELESDVSGDTLVSVEASVLQSPNEQGVTMLVPGSNRCRLRVTDLPKGEQEALPLSLGCEFIAQVRISPTGEQAAVAYTTVDAPLDDRPADVKVAVVDVRDGSVLVDEVLGQNTQCLPADCPPGVKPIRFEGFAWDGDHALRIATTSDTLSPAGQTDPQALDVGPLSVP